jgi:hypothetical protein
MYMATTNPATIKVFISYSWSSDEHVAWVAELGERLMSDGVDVVLDQWSLKEGHDLNSFMEQMVTDPAIKRVIVISDARYAEKADARKGGVGTESQIISQEVYQRVDQEKFIPVVRERDASKPCLPVFLKGRKYIDFSDHNNDAEPYDLLLRNIYDRPIRRKPVLGKPPAHLFDDNAVVIPAAQKGQRFRDVVTTGRGNPSAAFDDFAEEFLANLEDLRLTYSHDQKDTWCAMMFENIEKGRAYRDVYVDTVRCGVMHVREGWFVDALQRFLERLLPYQFRPKETGSYFKCSQDNYKFLIYEMFVYTIAVFIKSQRYEGARSLFDHHYFAPETLDGERRESYSYSQFASYAESLEGDCAIRGDSRRLSVMGDLLHDRANRKDSRFGDLLQADVICCLAPSRGRGGNWWPRSLVYSSSVGKLELFARATDEKGFLPLKIMLACDTPQAMIARICSQEMGRVWNARESWHSVFIAELLNLDELKHRWLPPSKTDG